MHFIDTPGGADFTMNVHHSAFSTKIEIGHAAPWKQYYWRFVADCTATFSHGGDTDTLSGRPNSEYMLLSK
ncbi:MAG: hypothetical protein HKP58_00500 [Desulfatitalea sp.]|nr:hypothetical protein [Desulfatitalea sp.]NNJ98870.1 hypothetical protein [Desulfatitalea sp.]